MNTDHSKIKEIDFNYITDGIYIGTNQCCQTHFEEKLVKEGITADISLEEERVDAPFGVKFYLWLPVKDQTSPTPDQLEFGVSALEKLVAMKKKIYVHCKNGHGRAPTLVAAYLIRKGKSPEEAEAFIKSKRLSIHLQDVQLAALRDFNRNHS
ncbi:MAG: dual specificity protein phosphatase family protein [Candidatus Harrisonbacteria bacterium]|nr:dual specificity protein phosphatase family protein [Candidatus Harrisonbacteria bacterium]